MPDDFFSLCIKSPLGPVFMCFGLQHCLRITHHNQLSVRLSKRTSQAQTYMSSDAFRSNSDIYRLHILILRTLGFFFLQLNKMRQNKAIDFMKQKNSEFAYEIQKFFCRHISHSSAQPFQRKGGICTKKSRHFRTWREEAIALAPFQKTSNISFCLSCTGLHLQNAQSKQTTYMQNWHS